MKSYKLFQFGLKTIFGADISINGYSYLLIYGKHINGYFCSIPNHNLGCEMAEPNDTYYNSKKLNNAGLDIITAKKIAETISQISNDLNI